MSTSRTVGSQKAGQKSVELDSVNLRILSVLRENGRISMAALAERVQVSRANAYARVEAMVEDGIITGFTARIDERKVGLGVTALVFVTVHPQTWAPFRERMRRLPDIEYCCVTTGEHDAMLLIRTVDVGAMHDFVTGVISAQPEVKSIVTVLVLDEVIDVPYLLPSDLPERDLVASPLGMTRFTRASPNRTGMTD